MWHKEKYQQVAGILHRQITKHGSDSNAAQAVRDVAFEIAAMFVADNARFNPSRFQTAVETGKETQ